MIFYTVAHFGTAGTMIEAPPFLLMHNNSDGKDRVRVDRNGRELETFTGRRALVDAMHFCAAVDRALHLEPEAT